MSTFQVDDMSCGHCAGSITRAVQALDASARVQVDLATHRVTVDGTNAQPQAISAAISAAGYTPVLVAGTSP